jgi:mono/diheme cytochrome c family protein
MVAPMMRPVARADDEIPAIKPLTRNEAAIKEGRSWFRNVCSVCHGGRADGAGDRRQGAVLRLFHKGFRKFVEPMKDGKDTGRTQTMPARGKVLSNEQMYQIGASLETVAIDRANWREPAK